MRRSSRRHATARCPGSRSTCWRCSGGRSRRWRSISIGTASTGRARSPCRSCSARIRARCLRSRRACSRCRSTSPPPRRSASPSRRISSGTPPRCSSSARMRAYLDGLRRAGALREIARDVDGRHELAAVTQASQRESDEPLLFHKVTGSRFPVMTNVFGSRARLMDMIGAADGSFCRRWVELMRRPAQAPRIVGAPNDLEDIRLTELPQITYFERDGGPYLTAGVFLAREPDGGVPNLSFHRCQIINDSELRVRLGRSHHLTQYQAKAEARGEALDAAILLGPPLGLVLAAAAPLAYDENEMEVAGKIAGQALDLRRCRTVDLDVPVDTEIVIEGRILPGERRPEGPFGEFMGYYVPVGDNHVFEVSAVTARRNAMFHSITCGSPEDLRLLEVAVATRTYQALMAACLEEIGRAHV